MEIKKRALVLEVGSGHFPHSRSNVLSDRFVFSNQQRSNFCLCFDRPLVGASGERLPFKDKAFDYLICRQVIEHCQNPQLFAKEISRVAKKGIMVCPQAVRERLFGWSYHNWYIEKKADQLIFFSKKSTNAFWGSFFHQLYQQKVFFRRFCQENEKKLNIYYSWEGKVNLKISSQKPKIKEWDKQLKMILKNLEFDYQKEISFLIKETTERVKNKIKRQSKKLNWQLKAKLDPKINIKLLKKIICCPFCYSDLKIEKKIICPKCKRKYPLIKGVPIFND